MANFNLNNPDQTATYTVGNTCRGTGVQSLQQVIDLKGKTLADTMTLFKLPVGSAVISATAQILEAAGETCTIGVGLQTTNNAGGVSANFIAAFDANAAAGTMYVGAGSDLIEGTGIQQAVGVMQETSKAASIYLGAYVASGTTFTAGKVLVSFNVAFA